MSPWLRLPEFAVGISPADLGLTYPPRNTCRMLGSMFVPAIVVLVVVIRMVSGAGLRTRDVNEGSEMEKGGKGGEAMVMRRGSGSVGVWRVE